jgi:hypothetical protein
MDGKKSASKFERCWKLVYCVAALSSIEPELASSGVPLYGVLHESLGAEEFRHSSTLS